jgi:hypothetical protein
MSSEGAEWEGMGDGMMLDGMRQAVDRRMLGVGLGRANDGRVSNSYFLEYHQGSHSRAHPRGTYISYT